MHRFEKALIFMVLAHVTQDAGLQILCSIVAWVHLAVCVYELFIRGAPLPQPSP